MILKQSEQTNQRAAAVIARGGVIAFRTDTFYGLGADPFNASAIQKIRRLKGREEHKPILVIISDTGQINSLIPKRSAAFDEVTQRLWPGPLTVIGAASPDLPTALTAGAKTVGVRLPDDDRVRAFVAVCGGALTATSANVSGEPPARTALEVERYFSDRVDLIIDGGEVKTDQASTVVDATSSELKLIREGAVPWAQIREALMRR